MKNPASMTAEQRDTYRDAVAGVSRGAVRKDVAGGVVYVSESNGAFYAMGFAGKAIKPAFNYRFRTEERRDAYVAEWVDSLAKKEQARQERRDARKAVKHPLLVGSILSSSWGYEQTNVSWYEVVAVISDKTVEIREIAGSRTSDGAGAMSGHSVPVPRKYTGPAMRKRWTGHGLTISSYATASVWDGKPEYASWYA